MSKLVNDVRSLTKIVAAIAIPERVTAEATPCKFAIIYGKKAARTDNTGILYIGTSSVNDTQFVQIAAGASLTLQDIDLSDLWLDVATAADGAMILYW